MSINIERVFEYLDTHPVSRHEGDFLSLLEMIRYIFTENNPVNRQSIQEKFQTLDVILQKLPFEEETAVSTVVCDLCYDYEQLGFDYGMLVGMKLMSEINALP